MNRSLNARLRNLEARRSPRPLHVIWSSTSDPEEWQCNRAELIASGKADPGDEFLCFGWRPPPSNDMIQISSVRGGVG
jgi:hypothetical protein